MSIISTILTKLATAIASLAVLLGIVHGQPVPASTAALASTSPVGLIPDGVLSNSSVSANHQFTDKNWSLAFTLRPEWNVNEILDSTDKLHQMQLSGTQQVIFISKDEALAVSGDLAMTTSTRTIAGQSVVVNTYTKPNSTYAYYQIFALKEFDGTYNFLLKSTTPDTTVTDTFIKSIVVKQL